jgi:type II secretory pathway component GspD/PulD (secretin)
MAIRAYFSSLALVTMLFTVTATLTARAADLTVIDLHNRTAEEMLPILKPLVGPDVALSGIDYKLLVRGDGSEVARVREALAVLDKAPRQLLISVRYDGQPQNKATDVGVAGTINNDGSQIAVRGKSTLHTASDSNVSTVRVLEGNGAHISTGQSVPVVAALMLPSRGGRQNVVAGMTTDYRELTSGFDVLPRVNGDRVVLDISTQQERAADVGQVNSGQSIGHSSAVVQRATTTIAGRIGEWIELGGVTSSITEQRTGISTGGASHRLSTQSDQRTIAVKVEQVD